MSREEPTLENAAVKPADTEFKLYLDAVNSASQRTRSTIYVLVAIGVLTLTAYRNTSKPDWVDSRLAQLQLASACVEKGGPFTNECSAAIDYSRGFLFSGRSHELLLGDGEEFKNELKEQIRAFIKIRTDALSLRLPFFGVVIDMNDLGLITGVFLSFVLYVLQEGLHREVDNLNRSKKKAAEATTLQKRKERLELLLMTQVLASRKGVTIGVHVLLVGVLLVHGAVVRDDWLTSGTAIALQGQFWGTWETRIDVGFFVLVIILTVLCSLRQRALDRTIDDLIVRLQGVEKLLESEAKGEAKQPIVTETGAVEAPK